MSAKFKSSIFCALIFALNLSYSSGRLIGATESKDFPFPAKDTPETKRALELLNNVLEEGLYVGSNGSPCFVAVRKNLRQDSISIYGTSNTREPKAIVFSV